MTTKTRILTSIVLTVMLFVAFVATPTAESHKTQNKVNVDRLIMVTFSCGEYGYNPPTKTLSYYRSPQNDYMHDHDYTHKVVNNCAYPLMIWFDSPDYRTRSQSPFSEKVYQGSISDFEHYAILPTILETLADVYGNTFAYLYHYGTVQTDLQWLWTMEHFIADIGTVLSALGSAPTATVTFIN